ncbi:hypothetical protein PoB_005938700 [Plakobranchus ocellatus]|uniref:Uncharacterized protein n=1 Tax=Plakobranchus ocellatus TaxID=259542 RepID=A0AAV4CMK3_9GAST|nr:hypothetical protein PoB_005938700 [Plakobranchus ocellatus]
MTTEYNSHENVAKREKANLKSLWKNLKIKAKKDHASHKKEMLKTDGGGTAEPMDKMSEGISDLLPNQFAAVENEFDKDYILEKGAGPDGRIMRIASDVRPGCKTQRIAPTLRQVADLMCARIKEREYFKTCIVGHVNCCLQCGPTLTVRYPPTS